MRWVVLAMLAAAMLAHLVPKGEWTEPARYTWRDPYTKANASTQRAIGRLLTGRP